MPKTEVILTSNIVGLGAESDHVKVASGYARNFLFPQRMAIPLTHANKRRIEALKQRRAEREAHEFNTMSELAKGVAKLVCVVQVKTGEDGKMFGSVTPGAIADQLKHQFDISLDKRKIHIEHPLRTLGEHEVELRLHQEVTARLKLRVESTTPAPAPAEALTWEGKREDRPDRRGRRGEPRHGEPRHGEPRHGEPRHGEARHGEAVEKPAAGKAEAGEKKPRVPKAEPRAEKPAKAEKVSRPEKPRKPAKGEEE